MWLSNGKFADNGGCGYILKPSAMRLEGTTFNPEAKYPIVNTLIVNVISGIQLPKPQAVRIFFSCIEFLDKEGDY
jgi:phosphatidylinositol phospholipase C delta